MQHRNGSLYFSLIYEKSAWEPALRSDGYTMFDAAETRTPLEQLQQAPPSPIALTGRSIYGRGVQTTAQFAGKKF